MSTTLFEPSVVKDVLCKHFNVPLDESSLTVSEKRYLGLGGDQIHYYSLFLKHGNSARHAFGKIAPNNEREFRSLEYLMKSVSKEEVCICRPIGLLQNGCGSLLLLEYLEGYANPFTILHSFSLLPKVVSSITRIGRDILDKMYRLQTHSPTTYGPLSLADIQETPGQPRPISVLTQLTQIQSLPLRKRESLATRINKVVKNGIMVRRGVVHGQMGMRNVMINGSNICFIDWEFMQYEGFCMFDPCYMVTMLLMRGVQLFIGLSELHKMAETLFGHIKRQEDNIADDKNRLFTYDSLWFASCLAMVDTLWQYENSENSGVKALLGQRKRQIKFLASYIEKNIIAA